MQFKPTQAPHIKPTNTVGRVMRKVLYALIPGTLIYVWFFGIGILVTMLIATAAALAAEAVMLRARGKPLQPYLSDYSAVVTAVLLALALPPLLPWWMTVFGSAFAIVFGKQLYGGLGHNPFNPAMVGYVVLLICFPVEMTTWLRPDALVTEGHSLGIFNQLTAIFTGDLSTSINVDAVTSATPLDTLKTGLANNKTLQEIMYTPLFGDLGGYGWEWIANGFALGGFWLLYKRVIRWQIPVALLFSLGVCAMVFYLIDPGSHAPPTFHIFSGAAILGAFFIATDPVTAPASRNGRLLYGACIGVLIYIIRTWGGYPEGLAFAVLLMNMATPLIDYTMKPRTYGHAS